MPGTLGGDLLIGHELAHVVQQHGGSEDAVQASGLSYGAYEAEADRAAETVVAGGSARLSPLNALAVQRAPPQEGADPDADRDSDSDTDSDSDDGTTVVLSVTAGDAPLERRMEAFKELILQTAVLRLRNNKANLLTWKQLIDSLPFDVEQREDLHLADMDSRATREGGMTRVALNEHLNSAAGSHMAAFKESQVFGANRACGGCHGARQAERLDREADPMGWRWTQTEGERIMGIAPAPLPGFELPASRDLNAFGLRGVDAHTVRSIELWVEADGVPPATPQDPRVHPPAPVVPPTSASPLTFATGRPGRERLTSDILDERVSAYLPIFRALGPSGYQVLDSDQYTWRQGTGEGIKARIGQNISDRRGEYQSLMDDIGDGDREWHEFVPIVQDLLPFAAQDVQDGLKEELDDAEWWRNFWAIATLGAVLLLLLLTVVLPWFGVLTPAVMASLGMQATVAGLEMGIGAYSVYQGMEMWDLGGAYSSATGADDVYTREQQQSADRLLTMGAISVISGYLSFAIGWTRSLVTSGRWVLQSAANMAGRSVSLQGGVQLVLGQGGAWTASVGGGRVLLVGQGADVMILSRTATGLEAVGPAQLTVTEGAAIAGSESTALALSGSRLPAYNPSFGAGAIPNTGYGGSTALVPYGPTAMAPYTGVSRAAVISNPMMVPYGTAIPLANGTGVMIRGAVVTPAPPPPAGYLGQTTSSTLGPGPWVIDDFAPMAELSDVPLSSMPYEGVGRAWNADGGTMLLYRNPSTPSAPVTLLHYGDDAGRAMILDIPGQVRSFYTEPVASAAPDRGYPMLPRDMADPLTPGGPNLGRSHGIPHRRSLLDAAGNPSTGELLDFMGHDTRYNEWIRRSFEVRMDFHGSPWHAIEQWQGPQRLTTGGSPIVTHEVLVQVNAGQAVRAWRIPTQQGAFDGVHGIDAQIGARTPGPSSVVGAYEIPLSEVPPELLMRLVGQAAPHPAPVGGTGPAGGVRPLTVLGNESGPEEDQAAAVAAGEATRLTPDSGVGKWAGPRGLQGYLRRSAGGGNALAPHTRAALESRVGFDLGSMRVHSDAEAGSRAAAMGARAFTSGSDVYMGSGELRPDLDSGMDVLAHEATHVAQNLLAGGGPVRAMPSTLGGLVVGRELQVRMGATRRADIKNAIQMENPDPDLDAIYGEVWDPPTPDNSIQAFVDTAWITTLGHAGLAGEDDSEWFTDAALEDFTSVVLDAIDPEEDDEGNYDAYDETELKRQLDTVEEAYEHYAYLVRHGTQDEAVRRGERGALRFRARASIFRDFAVANSDDQVHAVFLLGLAAATHQLAVDGATTPSLAAAKVAYQLMEPMSYETPDVLRAMESINGFYGHVLDAISWGSDGMPWTVATVKDDLVLDWLWSGVQLAISSMTKVEPVLSMMDELAVEIGDFLASVESDGADGSVSSHILALDAILTKYGGKAAIYGFIAWFDPAPQEEEDEDPAPTPTRKPEPEPELEPEPVYEPPPVPDPPEPEPVDVCAESATFSYGEVYDWVEDYYLDRKAFDTRWGDTQKYLCGEGIGDHGPSLRQAANNMVAARAGVARMLWQLGNLLKYALKRADDIEASRLNIFELLLLDLEKSLDEPALEWLAAFSIPSAAYSLLRRAMTEPALDVGEELQQVNQDILGWFVDVGYYQSMVERAIALNLRLQDNGVATYLLELDKERWTGPLDRLAMRAAYGAMPLSYEETQRAPIMERSFELLEEVEKLALVDLGVRRDEELQAAITRILPKAIEEYHAYRAARVPAVEPDDYLTVDDLWNPHLTARLPPYAKEEEKQIKRYVELTLAQVNQDALALLFGQAKIAAEGVDTKTVASLTKRAKRLKNRLGGKQDAADVAIAAFTDFNRNASAQLIGLYVMAQTALGGAYYQPGDVVRQANLLGAALEETNSGTLEEAVEKCQDLGFHLKVAYAAENRAWEGSVMGGVKSGDADGDGKADRQYGGKSRLSFWYDDVVFGLGTIALDPALTVSAIGHSVAASEAMGYLLQAEAAGGGDARKDGIGDLAAHLRKKGGSRPLSAAHFIYASILGIAHLVEELALPKAVQDAQTDLNRHGFTTPENMQLIDEQEKKRKKAVKDLDAGIHPVSGEPLVGKELVWADAWLAITGDHTFSGMGEVDWAEAADWLKQAFVVIGVGLISGGVGALAAGAGVGALGTTLLVVGTETVLMRTYQELSTGVSPQTAFLEDFAIGLVSMGASRLAQNAYRNAFRIGKNAPTTLRHGLGQLAVEYVSDTAIAVTHARISSIVRDTPLTNAQIDEIMVSNAAVMVAVKGMHVLGSRGTEWVVDRLSRGSSPPDITALTALLAASDAEIKRTGEASLDAVTQVDRLKLLDEQVAAMRTKLKHLEGSKHPQVREQARGFKAGLDAYLAEVRNARVLISINARTVDGTSDITYNPTPDSESALLQQLNDTKADYTIRQGLAGNIFEVRLPDGGITRFIPRKSQQGGGTHAGTFTPRARIEGDAIRAGNAPALMSMLKRYKAATGLVHPAINMGSTAGKKGSFSITSATGAPCTVKLIPVESLSTDIVTHEAGPAAYSIRWDGKRFQVEIEVVTRVSDDHIARGVNHEMTEVVALVQRLKAESGGDLKKYADRTELDRVLSVESEAGVLGSGASPTAKVTADDIARINEAGFLGSLLGELSRQISDPTTDHRRLPELLARRDLLLRDLSTHWSSVGLPADKGALDTLITRFEDAGAPLDAQTISHLQSAQVAMTTNLVAGAPMSMIDLQITFKELQKAAPNKMQGITMEDFTSYYQQAIADKAETAYNDSITADAAAGRPADIDAAKLAAITVIEGHIGGLSTASLRGRVFEGLSADAHNSDRGRVARYGRAFDLEPNNFPVYDLVTVKGVSAPLRIETPVVTRTVPAPTPPGGPAPAPGATIQQSDRDLSIYEDIPGGRRIFHLPAFSRPKYHPSGTPFTRGTTVAGVEVRLWSNKAVGDPHWYQEFRAAGSTTRPRPDGGLMYTPEARAAQTARLGRYQTRLATMQSRRSALIASGTPTSDPQITSLDTRIREHRLRLTVLEVAHQNTDVIDGLSNARIDEMITVLRRYGIDTMEILAILEGRGLDVTAP